MLSPIRVLCVASLALLAPATFPAQAPAPQFAAMEQAIASGSFQKITSVVVEQDGHIVYEHYFDGTVSTLRDTRSATKTVTSMLVGIAIDQHKIPSVNTPVLRYFPGITYANPDPRKATITLHDLM